jgi:hypothetical protein
MNVKILNKIIKFTFKITGDLTIFKKSSFSIIWKIKVIVGLKKKKIEYLFFQFQ